MIRSFVLLIAICAQVNAAGTGSSVAAYPGVAEGKQAAKPAKTPNILFIVADDLGFSDIGSFGGEIQTPNIDSLAEKGTVFSNFYAAAACAPSRSMLLTGVDNHRAGLGNMYQFLADNQLGRPGYEGLLNDRVATLPEILKRSGYHTYMAGKWHLGDSFDNSANARGFERSFSLLNGAASHFADMVGPHANRPRASYREDGELIDELPDDFYSSRFYTDKLIEHIDKNRSDGRPFFAYAAYTAPHWPIHAPDSIIDKYAGQYDEGYDRVRERRFQKLRQMELVPRQAVLPRRPESVGPWESLSSIERQRSARRMEVFAAMVDELDQNIGRLISYLEGTDQLDNTLIVFLSDNGSDAFSLIDGPDAMILHATTFDNSLENIGRRDSFELIGPEWAHVGEAPFRLYKMMSTEGGIRVPAIILYPAFGNERRVVDSNVSIVDIVPTIMAMLGMESPDSLNGKVIHRPSGRSLLPILNGSTTRVRGDDDYIGYELFGRRAVIKGDWKILYLPPPVGQGRWELFNLSRDPGEQVDLAARFPAKLNELKKDWTQYEDEYGVVLPPEGPMKLRKAPVPIR